jgi:hypothetical protein
MMVVIVLLGVIGTMVTSLVISTQRQTTAVRLRIDDVAQARIGLDSLTKTLRTAVQPAQLQVGCSACTGPASIATAVTTATPTSLQLFANFGAAAGPSLVTFTIAFDATLQVATMTQTTQAPDLNSAPNFTYTTCVIGAVGCSIRKRTLVKGLDWPLVDPAFTYLDNTATALVPAITGLTGAQLIQIAAVDIELPVHSPNRYNTAPTTIQARVGLPNAASGVLATP